MSRLPATLRQPAQASSHDVLPGASGASADSCSPPRIDLTRRLHRVGEVHSGCPTPGPHRSLRFIVALSDYAEDRNCPTLRLKRAAACSNTVVEMCPCDDRAGIGTDPRFCRVCLAASFIIGSVHCREHIGCELEELNSQTAPQANSEVRGRRVELPNLTTKMSGSERNSVRRSCSP